MKPRIVHILRPSGGEGRSQGAIGDGDAVLHLREDGALALRDRALDSDDVVELLFEADAAIVW